MFWQREKSASDTELCGFDKKPCIGGRCKFYTHIRGTDANTGKEIDQPGCSIEWLPVLVIETSKEVRQSAAATESFRNLYYESLVNLNKVTNPQLTQEEAAWVVTQRITGVGEQKN